ncbi:hypothetical protein GJAV_G00080970 [Gymnothorax javanicus]|nr:hypothetical protein GJAV_G00080970 [Gymnothorax javanicus]
MGIRMNFALCALVVFMYSSDIRGENATLPNATALSPPKALNRSEVATTTPINSSAGPVSNNSSQVNSTLSTPLTERATTNISKDSNVTGSTASTPLSTQHDDTLTNRTPAELPGSVGPSVSANGTSRPLTSSPEPSIPPTTNRLNISSPVPVGTTSNASVALSSRPSPTPPVNVPTTTGTPKTSNTASAKSHLGSDTSSVLNVGDEGSSTSRTLDPLLAGLVTVFIVSAAIVSLLLFLKFRKRNDGPEFRRLQDLPMDDMMEDTPLSMFSY